MAEENSQTTEQAPDKKKINKRFTIILALLIIVGGAFGIQKYLYAKAHKTTDDAQIQSNITAVTPRVEAFIKEVKVQDNQFVKKGDTLVILDPTDIETQVLQAQAAVEQAQSGITTAQAQTTAATSTIPIQQSQVQAVDADIKAAQARLWQATQNYNRYSNLFQEHVITKQQFEQMKATFLEAQASLQALQHQKIAAAKQMPSTISQSHVAKTTIATAKANLARSEAALKAAKINLSYTVITAPATGFVSRVDLQNGQLVSPGQQLFTVVDKNIWAVANYKETQVGKMRIGQKAEVTVDAFPGHVFQGKLASFSPATGSQMSLLPPDNSTGNFVKVVQRIPVKVEFTDQKDPLLKLVRPGMNVEVNIFVK